ncbi:hypothetical protein ABZY16_07775 [Streptomyces sp. NPDC006553]|uniref:hypothetical protein n=1 Tax=unclassified Streptomyces TaxID=2593676 RepID=UPI002251D167|nr:hypothetical protein [Streptomyces sp. NBC_00233]MCX5232559.1 hypothetical protein [Streptomyces sp. NBC_00233]
MPRPASAAARKRPAANPAHGDTAVMTSRPQLLGIYLNDHLAGAAAGVELFRRAARVHRGTALGPPLASIALEVTQDRESLRRIMAALDLPVKRHRIALGRLAEKAGRLKLNGRVLSRSPLSDVLELEAMRLGVEGKACAWRSLEALAGTDARIDVAHVRDLLRRAERQIQVLETLRVERAAEVFTADGVGAGSDPPNRR